MSTTQREMRKMQDKLAAKIQGRLSTLPKDSQDWSMRMAYCAYPERIPAEAVRCARIVVDAYFPFLSRIDANGFPSGNAAAVACRFIAADLLARADAAEEYALMTKEEFAAAYAKFIADFKAEAKADAKAAKAEADASDIPW